MTEIIGTGYVSIQCSHDEIILWIFRWVDNSNYSESVSVHMPGVNKVLQYVMHHYNLYDSISWYLLDMSTGAAFSETLRVTADS